MDTKLIDTVSSKFKKVQHPDFAVGDVIEVHTKIKEGDKERIQIFKGIVISRKGEGISKSYTVRKISYGVGVEKTFPLYSPNVEKIKIVTRGKVRKSKLYYLRDRIGKAALKAGIQTPAEGENLETKILEEVGKTANEAEIEESIAEEPDTVKKEEKVEDKAGEKANETSEKTEDKKDDGGKEEIKEESKEKSDK